MHQSRETGSRQMQAREMATDTWQCFRRAFQQIGTKVKRCSPETRVSSYRKTIFQWLTKLEDMENITELM